ncbi:GDSL-type esterase/lipase family protein [Hufsiella ginkgonis]|uniref:GDSL family lipase n=1 Tax=Hufsiella ginkgonis TaxID=2695274 RepID=A0A7K1XYH9_9SPHI|nr:GDSL-type esterase/lipase family protein [Hufsiella ginkgonis]MXV16003.1 GDSL family lipase [Hufsiella ginkgonis]
MLTPRSLFPIVFLLVFSAQAYGQQSPRFSEDVKIIKAYDKLFEPPADPILFVGSSSIRKWTRLEQVFGAYNVINRGVGGTVTNEITGFAKDIIFPYNPRQIVIYVGENDVVNEQASADTIFNRFKVLYATIRQQMPVVPIVYISLKPSPSREKFVEKTKAVNKLIKTYLAAEKNTAFVDVFSKMLDKNGKMRPELFVSDMLHMKPEGYMIWEKAVRPYLLK